jgi:hypothetical protein
MQFVDMDYKKMLTDPDFFILACRKNVTNKLPVMNKEYWPSIDGLLELLDLVVDMFKDAGFRVVYALHEAVKRHHQIHFDAADGWQLCCLSALPSRHCVIVEDMTVHVNYIRLLQCLWLVTHMHELESTKQDAPATTRHHTPPIMKQHHEDLYREAFCLIFQELENLYDVIIHQVKL